MALPQEDCGGLERRAPARQDASGGVGGLMQEGVKQRGWYSRGYIPHYDGGDMYQVITYRLADSLPKEKLRELDVQLQGVAPGDVRTVRRKRIEGWLDSGYGCCILQDPVCAHIVIEAWKYFDGVRYDLAAWVVMPNHVHVLAYFRDGWPMGKVVNSWKSYTARQINRIMRDNGKAPVMSDGRSNTGLWQRGYWDRYIRSETHFENTIRYIVHNPITAGLVKRARDWPFCRIETDKAGRRLRWRPPKKSVTPKPDTIRTGRNR